MSFKFTRRSFLISGIIYSIFQLIGKKGFSENKKNGGKSKLPVVIASANGLKAVEKAYQIMMEKGSPLDAVVAGVNIVENDPEDQTVGYGGLPNEEGEVELDAAVMDGKTARAGAVAALKYIKNPSNVAKLILQYTDHIMLVGEGALKFALSFGFEKENLLTEKSRQEWLKWKASRSKEDDWLDEEERKTIYDLHKKEGGTIHCSGVDLNGDLACVTTTSGLPFKIPGRVGDSPLIGCGLYVDNEIGSAGATGRGEAVIKICGAHTIVELMRKGLHPTDACLEALKRIVKTTKEVRLLNEKGLPNFNVKFYALRKDGVYGSASLMSGGQYAVADEKGVRLMDAAYLYKTS